MYKRDESKGGLREEGVVFAVQEIRGGFLRIGADCRLSEMTV